ncbi:MAG TPA: hypothetical protein VFZ41_08240 [Solirubrobacterales bacterium]
MKRPKGPELKMPDLKVPTFAADVYWDLRERRLLPLVALVVVAILATPFLLGEESEQAASPPSGASTAPGGVMADGSKLTVVQAKPGLRDYHKRLSDRDPDDPFIPHYTAPVTDDAELNPETGSPETTVPIESGGDEDASPGGSPPGDTPSYSPGEKPKLTLFAFAIKVSITKAGGKTKAGKRSSAKKERTVRDRVLPHTSLPGKKAPVVTYMGPSGNGKKAVMLVSTKVESVFGDIRCLTNEDICQLIEVEPGFPVTFVYGANEVRYTINVIKIEPVITGRY